MEYSVLPDTDLRVSRVCLGTWQFNNSQVTADRTWNAQDEQTTKSIIDKALDLGVNFLDTAEGYVNSEETLGKILEGRRRDVVIASKVGARLSDYCPTDIEQSLTASLAKLKTDYIDLYQIHWPTMIQKNFQENLAEVKRLQAKGLIRYYSVCNFGPQNLNDAVEANFKPVTNQLPYNLLWRAVEYEILPVCMKHNIGVLAYSPLQQGLLTGKFHTLDDVPEGRRRTRLFNSKSTSLSRHGTEGAEKQLFKALADLRVVCSELGVEMSQAALSWILQQPPVQSVIVGASSPQQIENNVKRVTLDQAVIDKMNSVTLELKEALGSNVDPWAAESRMA